MPFILAYRDAAAVSDADLAALLPDMAQELGALLTKADPGHIVTASMVDWVVQDRGALDSIRAPLFVSVFARHEYARRTDQQKIVDALHALATSIVQYPVVVELLLTHHASSFDYSTLGP